MTRFIEGVFRDQVTLLPESLDDYVAEDNPVRVVYAFIDMLDLGELGFVLEPKATGRPGYHPGLMLRIYLYGYLNQVQSSRRLERECGRNLELLWLTGRLKPDFKTIADFRKDNGPAIRKVCQQFVALCRDIKLLDSDIVTIDGSRFKAVNSKANSYTRAELKQKTDLIHLVYYQKEHWVRKLGGQYFLSVEVRTHMPSKTNNIEIDTQELVSKLTELEKLAGGDVSRILELLLLENHVLRQNQSSGMLRRRKLDFSTFPRFLKLTNTNVEEINNASTEY